MSQQTEKTSSDYKIKKEIERGITRALMSFPFLPRSLVTTTFGAEFDEEAIEAEEIEVVAEQGSVLR